MYDDLYFDARKDMENKILSHPNQEGAEIHPIASTLLRIALSILLLICFTQLPVLASPLLLYASLLIKPTMVLICLLLLFGFQTKQVQWISLVLLWIVHGGQGMPVISLYCFYLSLFALVLPLDQGLSIDALILRYQKLGQGVTTASVRQANQQNHWQRFYRFGHLLFQLECLLLFALLGQAFIFNRSSTAILLNTMLGLYAILILLLISLRWIPLISTLLYLLGLGCICILSIQVPELWILLIPYLSFLPATLLSWLWRGYAFLYPKLWVNRRPMLLFYDGDCGVCTICAKTITCLDIFGMIEIQDGSLEAFPSQYATRADFDEDRQKTVIAWDKERGLISRQQYAFAQVFDRLIGCGLLAILMRVSGRLGEKLYDGFAKNRHIVSAFLGLGQCGIGGKKKQVALQTSSDLSKWVRALCTLWLYLFLGILLFSQYQMLWGDWYK
jgi:predicted DCC family thiol-disulfide oxidoreductase YuxK